MLFSILLATIKLLVGIISGSLSILADAADSVIDLISAGITLLAVRIADLPPDANHPYGHARADNLGALGQAMLLIVTACWFIWQALERIIIAPAIPELNSLVLLVVIVSLLLNGLRIYHISRATSTSKSETLTASVANFANDMLASLVVLLVLGLIMLHSWLPLPPWFIQRVDAFGAIIVALFALNLAWRLGARSIAALMDSIPDDLNQRLAGRIGELPAVVPNSAHVRARFVGEQPFVEVTVGMPRGHSLEEAHELADSIEAVVCHELAAANVVVHVEPARTMTEPYTTTVYSVAQQLGLRVHNLDLYQLTDEMRVEMDLELPSSMTLGEAHTYSERLEAAIAAEMPCQTTVAVHLEPRYDEVQPVVRYKPVDERVDAALGTLPHVSSIVRTSSLLSDDGIIVTLHCRFPGKTPLTEVHAKMSLIERDLRRALPDIVRVQIDPEPSDTPEDGAAAGQAR
jgi:cation diffusion facilitator family transporter